MEKSPSLDRPIQHSATDDTTSLSELLYPSFALRREACAPYAPGGAEEAHLPGNFTKSVLQNLPGIARDILTRRERVTPSGIERLSPESLEHNVEILRFNVLVKNLPMSFSGFTILHATDLHLAAEDQTPLLRLQTIFESLCNQDRRPDCMIITGDFVHRSFTECSDEFLAHLTEWTLARVPILYVLGNHDNRDGQRPRLKALLDGAGAIDITNSDWSIRRGVDEIRVLGLDDFTTGLPSTPPLSNSGCAARIMALHNPEGFPDSILPHLSLILAGHIHQGEIRFSFSRDGAHYFDGISIMKRDPSSGYTDRFGIQDWASVDGTPLYVSAGLARRWEHKGFPYSFRKRNPSCSVAIHRLLPSE